MCIENERDTFKQVVMPFRSQLEDGAAEEIELDGHLGAHGGVDDAELVGGEDLEGIVAKVQHGNEAGIANDLVGGKYT